jgi:hypothetical protein
MKHWTNLRNEQNAEDIRARADGLLKLAGTTSNSSGGRSSTEHQRPLRLLDVGRNDDDAADMELKIEMLQMHEYWIVCAYYTVVDV